MSDEAGQEMTLAQYMEKLPEGHRARKALDSIFIDHDKAVSKLARYEREYLLPLFAAAKKLGFDLEYMVHEIAGKNCAELFVNAIDSQIQGIMEVLAALGVFPDGYCFCSVNPDSQKPDAEHQGECQEARALLKHYDPKGFDKGRFEIPQEGDKIPDSMPTTQRLLKKLHGEIGYEVVGNKIVERYTVPESITGEPGCQGLSDVARCRNPEIAKELCDLLNLGRKLKELVEIAPELNLCNYEPGEVAELNGIVIEMHNIVKELE